MIVFIPKTTSKLMLFLVILLVTACNNSTASHLKKLEVKHFVLPSGKKIKTYIAKTLEEQKAGLSNIKSEDFSQDEGMLFPAEQMYKRQFWMPETHFNLDVIFMNADYYVLEIHRNLQHFPTREPRNQVPLSKQVYSQHVLEVRADSELASEIQPGMILKLE